MARFAGKVTLSQEQYDELVLKGKITINGVEHEFNPDILYITPNSDYLNKGDITLTLKDNGAYTLTINKE